MVTASWARACGGAMIPTRTRKTSRGLHPDVLRVRERPCQREEEFRQKDFRQKNGKRAVPFPNDPEVWLAQEIASIFLSLIFLSNAFPSAGEAQLPLTFPTSGRRDEDLLADPQAIRVQAGIGLQYLVSGDLDVLLFIGLDDRREVVVILNRVFKTLLWRT